VSEIWDVEMGYVTTRRGARLHLVIADGLAYCNSGSGVIITSRKARMDDAPNICKKCHDAVRARLVNVINVRSRRAAPGHDLDGVAGNISIITSCEDLAESMMTQAERVERDEMLSVIRQNMSTSREVSPKPAMETSPESDDKLTLF